MTLGSFKPSDSNRNSRLVASALTVAVVVFVAIGIGAELVFLPKASTSSASTTSTTTVTNATVYGCAGCGTPSSTVRAAATLWVADFNDRDVAGIGSFYGQDALVTVMGGRAASASLQNFGDACSGLVLDGAYKGLENIKILYGSSIGGTANLTATVANYSENDVNPYNANVSLTLSMVGYSYSVGNLNITVDANQQWNYVGGQWQIVKGTWNYVTFDEQYPVAAGG
jgi:hypothetical protein